MVDISINKASISFGFKKVLDSFNLEINSADKIGIIGANGCGKTTLLKVIVGIEHLNSGIISIRKDATIGILEQIPNKTYYSKSVSDIFDDIFQEINEVELKLRELEKEMSDCKDDDKLNKILKKYGNYQEIFTSIGGYEKNIKIDKICNGFSFDDEFKKRKFSSLSGGEKTKVMLASLLLKQPDILLLDEPTNHLDIDTIEWLEKFLNDYKGTVLIISHDRYFLDNVVNKIVLIEKGHEEIFFGNYSYYIEEKEKRILSEFDNYKNQQVQIEKMRAAIKKLREWGKIGDNESFFKRANCIEKRLEKMELLDKPQQKKELPIILNIDERSGNDVLMLENGSLCYDNNILLNEASMYIRFGEKVCLMGKNGSGKTSLIKSIISNKDLTGNLKIGSNIKIGYIPQEIYFDDNNSTILEEARTYFDGTETHLRASLAKFLFYGENVFKKVGTLSGGEKVRLKLFELIQKKANFLILDEPTNHIDIDTKEMLEEALNEYDGTLLFVSHDRYFINKLAEKIYNIDNDKLTLYLGNYDYFKEQKTKKLVPSENISHGRRK